MSQRIAVAMLHRQAANGNSWLRRSSSPRSRPHHGSSTSFCFLHFHDFVPEHRRQVAIEPLLSYTVDMMQARVQVGKPAPAFNCTAVVDGRLKRKEIPPLPITAMLTLSQRFLCSRTLRPTTGSFSSSSQRHGRLSAQPKSKLSRRGSKSSFTRARVLSSSRQQIPSIA